MRALRFAETGGSLEVVELDRPDCPVDGVLVEVGATGVCRSDWHAWRGHDPVALPHVPGHEFAGTIAEVGAAVTGWSVGDRVTVPFVLGCGRCEWCAAGQAQVCPDQEQPGFTLQGSFADFVAVPRADVNLVALPDGVDLVTAAALGCRFATAHRALTVHGRLSAGQRLLVLGLGGVGLSCVQIGAALGAEVVGVDPSSAARELAGRSGAGHVLDPADPDLRRRILELSDGGVHVGVDALGKPELVDLSVRSLRRRGRHVQVGLLLEADAATAVPFDLIIARELELYGSHGMAAGDYPALLDLVVSGAVRPAELVTRRLSLTDGTGVFADLDAGVTGMTVLVPGGASATTDGAV